VVAGERTLLADFSLVVAVDGKLGSLVCELD
jgi:hypothetical protein